MDNSKETPNRLKFISQVKALDPTSYYYAKQVAGLEEARVRRELLHSTIMTALATAFPYVQAAFADLPSSTLANGAKSTPEGRANLLFDRISNTVHRVIAEQYS